MRDTKSGGPTYHITVNGDKTRPVEWNGVQGWIFYVLQKECKPRWLTNRRLGRKIWAGKKPNGKWRNKQIDHLKPVFQFVDSSCQRISSGYPILSSLVRARWGQHMSRCWCVWCGQSVRGTLGWIHLPLNVRSRSSICVRCLLELLWWWWWCSLPFTRQNLFQLLSIWVFDRTWMGLEDRRVFPFERLRSGPALGVVLHNII